MRVSWSVNELFSQPLHKAYLNPNSNSKVSNPKSNNPNKMKQENFHEKIHNLKMFKIFKMIQKVERHNLVTDNGIVRYFRICMRVG